MKDYHPEPNYFVGALCWQPYTMFFNQPSHKSKAFNTDPYGFRFTYKENSFFGFDAFRSYSGSKSILVGSSFAFGVGASSDRHTISTYLSERGSELFLNMGGRSHNFTQEIINVLLHVQKISDINRIIFLSGLNNLELFYSTLPETYPAEWMFFLKPFLKALENCPPLSLREHWHRFIRHISALISCVRKNKTCLPHRYKKPSLTSTFPNYQSFRNVLCRDFAMLRLLQHDYKVYYVLQPFAPWTDKILTPEEQELFVILSTLQPVWAPVLSAMESEYCRYTSLLKELCIDSGIIFYDLNPFFKEQEWYFVDRIHMNDSGYKKTAMLLLEHVLRL
jgi:hypothetical protein